MEHRKMPQGEHRVGFRVGSPSSSCTAFPSTGFPGLWSLSRKLIKHRSVLFQGENTSSPLDGVQWGRCRKLFLEFGFHLFDVLFIFICDIMMFPGPNLSICLTIIVCTKHNAAGFILLHPYNSFAELKTLVTFSFSRWRNQGFEKVWNLPRVNFLTPGSEFWW